MWVLLWVDVTLCRRTYHGNNTKWPCIYLSKLLYSVRVWELLPHLKLLSSSVGCSLYFIPPHSHTYFPSHFVINNDHGVSTCYCCLLLLHKFLSRTQFCLVILFCFFFILIKLCGKFEKIKLLVISLEFFNL